MRETRSVLPLSIYCECLICLEWYHLLIAIFEPHKRRKPNELTAGDGFTSTVLMRGWLESLAQINHQDNCPGGERNAIALHMHIPGRSVKPGVTLDNDDRDAITRPPCATIVLVRDNTSKWGATETTTTEKRRQHQQRVNDSNYDGRVVKGQHRRTRMQATGFSIRAGLACTGRRPPEHQGVSWQRLRKLTAVATSRRVASPSDLPFLLIHLGALLFHLFSLLGQTGSLTAEISGVLICRHRIFLSQQNSLPQQDFH